MGEQSDNLDRVTEKIKEHVMAFCRMRLATKRDEFYVEELRRYVSRALAPYEAIAPASPDRVLRHLRQLGLLDYLVIARADSLYKVLEVGEGKPKPAPTNGADWTRWFK